MAIVRKFITEYLAEQQAWMDEHGGTLAGYVARYGSAADAEHYGDGGEAIFAADKAHMDYLLKLRGEGRTYLPAVPVSLKAARAMLGEDAPCSTR
jgi:hypothetical protein